VSVPNTQLHHSKNGPPAPNRAALPQFLPDNIKHPSRHPGRDAQVAALRVLAVSLLKQIETIEQRDEKDAIELNLHDQVQQFEAALIRSALERTGGRQRRAARLLGVKVTTLNTKIKRHQISIDAAPRIQS
jgi:DNA-binding NtrC family response regulator